MNHFANAGSGQLPESLTKEEAVEVAKMRVNGEFKVKKVDFLTIADHIMNTGEAPYRPILLYLNTDLTLPYI
jgi:hypothetical protein